MLIEEQKEVKSATIRDAYNKNMQGVGEEQALLCDRKHSCQRFGIAQFCLDHSTNTV